MLGGSIRDIIVAVLIGVFTLFGVWVGWKAGSSYGYIKGLYVKLNPFVRDEENGGGGRILPFPLPRPRPTPGDTGNTGDVGDMPSTSSEDILKFNSLLKVWGEDDLNKKYTNGVLE